jgi:hypothetical protein
MEHCYLPERSSRVAVERVEGGNGNGSGDGAGVGAARPLNAEYSIHDMSMYEHNYHFLY